MTCRKNAERKLRVKAWQPNGNQTRKPALNQGFVLDPLSAILRLADLQPLIFNKLKVNTRLLVLCGHFTLHM